MAFTFLIAGAILLIASIRNTQGDLYTLVAQDFTGSDNFIFWMVSILLIGAVGYIPKLKPVSVGFLTLVILVLFLTKGNPQGTGGGFFAQAIKALDTTTKAGSPQQPGPANTGTFTI